MSHKYAVVRALGDKPGERVQYIKQHHSTIRNTHSTSTSMHPDAVARRERRKGGVYLSR